LSKYGYCITCKTNINTNEERERVVVETVVSDNEGLANKVEKVCLPTAINMFPDFLLESNSCNACVEGSNNDEHEVLNNNTTVETVLTDDDESNDNGSKRLINDDAIDMFAGYEANNINLFSNEPVARNYNADNILEDRSVMSGSTTDGDDSTNAESENNAYIPSSDELVLMGNSPLQSMETNYSNNMFCRNCNRVHIQVENHDVLDVYETDIQERLIPNKPARFRRKFCLMKYEDVATNRSDENVSVALCRLCYNYLRADIAANQIEVVWPALFWSWLSNIPLQQQYGNYIWKLIPIKWRPWWIKTVTKYNVYRNVTINEPESIFIDQTPYRNHYIKTITELESKTFSPNFNKLLKWIIKCPWGCDSCYHNCGEIELDLVVSRCLGSENIVTVTKNFNTAIDKKTVGIRSDFLKDDVIDYFCCQPIRENRIMPSLSFTPDGKVVVLTCSNHDGGDSGKYLHVPRNPYGSLNSLYSDELAPAVIKPRILKPVKRKKFSNIYSMHKMQGNFSGIDTMYVKGQGDFNSSSKLKTMNECLSINGRNDIKSLCSS
jgi:hypothetical protein